MPTAPVFDEALSLPDWLHKEFSFRRRIYRGGRWAMHFVDQGEGPTVLLQHGNPTWSYLWRKVIRRLADEKVRIVAPDMVGLGLSDKPREAGLHSLPFHALNLGRLVAALDLREMIVVGQDWGGPILGLMAAQHPDRVAGAVFANTGLGAPRKKRPLSLFHLLAHLPLVSTLLFRGLNFPLPVLHRAQGDPGSIGPHERRAYGWPLRTWRDRTAPLALARLVPTGPDHPTALHLRKVRAWAETFPGPVRLVWGMQDPILGRALKSMRAIFPTAPVTETRAGHFLQEEVPDVLTEAILEVLATLRPKQ